jgi:hypothetical protein
VDTIRAEVENVISVARALARSHPQKTGRSYENDAAIKGGFQNDGTQNHIKAQAKTDDL